MDSKAQGSALLGLEGPYAKKPVLPTCPASERVHTLLNPDSMGCSHRVQRERNKRFV
jgi:hypothetical protein